MKWERVGEGERLLTKRGKTQRKWGWNEIRDICLIQKSLCMLQTFKTGGTSLCFSCYAYKNAIHQFHSSLSSFPLYLFLFSLFFFFFLLCIYFFLWRWIINLYLVLFFSHISDFSLTTFSLLISLLSWVTVTFLNVKCFYLLVDGIQFDDVERDSWSSGKSNLLNDKSESTTET